jgi:hypothetical protein
MNLSRFLMRCKWLCRRARFGCIFVLLHCFVCQPYPKYSNCHILASICPFDPISSPFLICMILASILMRCKRLWAGSFWMNFGHSAMCWVSIVLQKRYRCIYVLWSSH